MAVCICDVAVVSSHGVALVLNGLTGLPVPAMLSLLTDLCTNMARTHIDKRSRLVSAAVDLEPVDVHFMWRPQLADPADEIVLEAAVNGRASAIVTHNVHDFLPAARDFEIEVITPSVMLQRMRK